VFASAHDKKAPGDSSTHHSVWKESDTTREEDITMYQFMQRFGRDRQARGRGTGPLNRVRRRNHPLNCEALESRQLLAGFYIVNEASGKVLDDPGASPNNGAFIDQYQLNGGMNQRWDLIFAGGNTYFIRNEASGLVLDNGLSTIEGTKIGQWQSYFGANQQWQLTLTPDASLGNGNYFCSGIVNAYSQMALDNSLSTSNGYPIDQWPYYGGSNQEWVLLAAADAPPGRYNIVNANSDAPLNDPASQNPNLPFGGNNARTAWDFAPLANNSNLIVSEDSGNVLDDPNFSQSSGTALDLTSLSGTVNQQWYVRVQPYGNVGIQNVSSNLVVDQPVLSNGISTQFIQDQLFGTLSQEWYLAQLPFGVDIHGQPSNAVVGQPISPAITVAVVDAKGNTITTNNTQLVKLAIASGPAGAQLLGTTTVRAVNGVADFTKLRLSLPGTYTLTDTGGALTPDFSNVFTIAPATVASHVTIRRGSVHKVGRTSHRGSGGELVAQTITIKNAGPQPLGGPLALRVGGLPSGVTLANATGTYEGVSYRDVLAANQPLAPGKSVTVTLDFSVTGRRSPGLSKLDEDLEALLGI
jgi:hypothetical protein